MTEHDKIDIRRAYREANNPTKQVKILSELYATDIRTIKQILGIEQRRKTGGRTADMNKVKKAIEMRETGMKQAEVAEALGVSVMTVYRWEKEYKHA